MTDRSTQPAPLQGPPPEPARQRHNRPPRDAVVVGGILAASGIAASVAFGTGSARLLSMVVFLTLALPVIFGASMRTGRGFVASAVLAAVVIGAWVVFWDPANEVVYSVSLAVVLIGGTILYTMAWLLGLVVGFVWRWMRRRWLRP
jgi:hypothetical protein